VQKFNTSGTYVTQWGSSGSGNGQFNACYSIWVDSHGDVYVTDRLGNRVEKFSSTGAFIAAFDDGLNLVGALGISGDNAGNMYISDQHRIMRFAVPTTVVDDVSLTSYSTSTTLTETSDPVTLDVDDMWLIHPAVPGLSVSLAHDDVDMNNVQNIGDITLPSRATRHDILGQKNPISVSSSPRGSDNLVFQIAVEDSGQESALRGLFADQTPILFQVPPDWNLGFASDFYDVGDVTIGRQVQQYGEDSRVFSLPLVAVESPIVTITPDAVWTWADVFATYASWDVVKLAYNSWDALFADNRNPGF
jgi:hypothetical protein